MKEWFGRTEIAAAANGSLPADMGALARHIDQNGWHGDPARVRPRTGRGGGFEYHVSLLPADVQARLVARETLADAAPVQSKAEARSSELWRRFEAMPDKTKQVARDRLAVVQRVETLAAGMTRQLAVALVAGETGHSTSTLWNWLKLADDFPASDRLPALAPRYRGRTAKADCDPRAFACLVTDYLRPERPNFDACYRRMVEAATVKGWSPVPSAKTLKRRIERDIPAGARVLARLGGDAVKRIYPHQRRDRSVFQAMQAVNADGHTFDVFVRFDDGSIGRPVMVAWQDLHSGKVVGHRVDTSESWTLVRLAFADMVESFGIPEEAWLDNGRAFASKWLTGGMPNRYRFTVRDDEPSGILTQLGVAVHWTTPYHGQAKPIERAFGSLCEEIARHPKCAGAYTGNRPDAKPENYASRAIPIADFRLHVAEQIARHNARTGRRSAVAAGRSFDEAFAASLAAPGTMVRRASEEQRRMFLSAAEGVTARKPTGEVEFAGNRYWAEPLADRIGDKLVIRFDPQDLMRPLPVYTLDGRFVCEAECIAATGFNDVDAAREHARKRRLYVRRMREALDLERTLTIDEVAALMPAPTMPKQPEPKVVRLVANGLPRPEPDDFHDAFARGVERLFGPADPGPSGQAAGLSGASVVPFQREEGGRG